MAKLTTAQKAEQRIAELKQKGIDQMLKVDVMETLTKLNLFDTASYLHAKNVKSKNAEKLIKAIQNLEKAEQRLYNLILDAFTEQVGEISEKNYIQAMHLIEECTNAPKYKYQISETFAPTTKEKPKRTRKPRTKKVTEGCIETPHAIPTEGSISTNE